jgi:hypothetical protein
MDPQLALARSSVITPLFEDLLLFRVSMQFQVGTPSTTLAGFPLVPE